MNFAHWALQFRRAVIVAPHPDDETIGAFGLIRCLLRAGVKVKVTVVTDGAASHPASRLWSAPRLALLRRREVFAAMRLAGLSRGDICFLDYPDGQLSSLDDQVFSGLIKRLASGPMPDLVVGPSCHDAHPDHAAVAEACLEAWPRRVVRASYLVWPAGEVVPGAARYLLGGDIALKRTALRTFRSQTGLITDDPNGFTITRMQERSFLRPAERFLVMAQANR